MQYNFLRRTSLYIYPGSNSSFITFVPKVNDPLSLSDYRPINLIGCISKVISKVLEERLKQVMDTIISTSQTAFLKGRSILNGPLIVNEIYMGQEAKEKNLTMGFGEKWRAWINGLISTTKCSVLINGAPTKEFRMEKGVRPGYSLTPFLFIIAAEGLNIAFREAQCKNHFKGVSFNNLEADVSLLQYADDAIILGEWDPRNTRNLVRILTCFELCSSLKVNLSKSRLMGVSVSNVETRSLARWLKCKEGTIPFNYLGLPVGGNMTRSLSCQLVVDKVKGRLWTWKANHFRLGAALLMQICPGESKHLLFLFVQGANEGVTCFRELVKAVFLGRERKLQRRQLNCLE
ncbi:hypothetical protein OSB04_012302 [Centaurea solstitialis]|uniref:Reverse transcriptase domain-containing protein n=1 Tax=Centaurea solstitialis TaxID=347529 RepID=A0AA38TIN9_9ASTR|nr:hypothetical protein OSB04_012302 [Centaurea solstitialis]